MAKTFSDHRDNAANMLREHIKRMEEQQTAADLRVGQLDSNGTLDIYSPKLWSHPPAPKEHFTWAPMEKLAMRLSKGPGEEWSQGITVAIFTGPNTMFVFAAKGDKAIIFEDDVNLFPSDSLIGQFRLFAESTS